MQPLQWPPALQLRPSQPSQGNPSKASGPPRETWRRHGRVGLVQQWLAPGVMIAVVLAVGQGLSGKIDQTNDRIDLVNGRIDLVNTRIDEAKAEFSAEIRGLGSRIDQLYQLRLGE